MVQIERLEGTPTGSTAVLWWALEPDNDHRALAKRSHSFCGRRRGRSRVLCSLGESQRVMHSQDHREGRRRLAALQARRLARTLGGLPADDVMDLTRLFITNFLDALFHHKDLDAGSLVELAQVPLDVVLRRQKKPKKP